MVIKHCTKLMAGALMLSLTAGAFAAADTGVAEQLKSLRAEVAQLRADSDANWLNERRVEQVKDIVREVLADADTRASLLENGMSAGHNGKHFFLASEDGSFLLNVGGQIQFRYVYNERNIVRAPIGQTDSSEFGFTLRRVKLFFNGHISSPKIRYSIGIQTDRNNETLYLDHAFVEYDLRDDVAIWAGERKAPFLREELTSSKRQLAVDRSLVNEVFTAGRVQGIGAIWTANENVVAQVAITDGINSGEAGPGATKDFDGDATDFAITGRVDIRVLGDWAQKNEFTTWSGRDSSLFVGAAAHYEVGETGDQQVASPGVDSVFAWTVDASATCDQGATLYAAVIGQHTDAVSGGTDLDHYGYLVQGSYHVIADKLEPFIRYELIDIDGVGVQDISLLTFGANWYLNKHASKFTLDLVWALDPINSVNTNGTGTSGLGLLADDANKEDQLAFRAQFQLTF